MRAHRVEFGQRLVDGTVAPDDLRAAQSHHARPVVLQAQDDASADLPAHARHLLLGRAVRGQVLQLSAHDGLNLVDLVGAAARVHPEGTRVGVSDVVGVGRISQATLFAHLLEEARGHGPAKDREQHTHRGTQRISGRQAFTTDEDVRLRDVALSRDVLLVVGDGRRGR